MRFIAVLLILLSAPIAHTQEPEAEREKMELEPTPQTVEEALKRREAAEAEARKGLEAAQMAFDEQIEKADQQAITAMEQVARRAVAAGQLAEASKAWEEVLRIDISSKPARAFFRTIGRFEVVRELAKEAAKDGARNRWVKFVTESGRVFQQLPNGMWADVSPDGDLQYTLREVYRNQHRIMLEQQAKGNALHTITADLFMWKDRGDSTWHWGESGSWVE